LIGKRTWCGLVGVLGFPVLLDGGTITAPNLAFWTREGGWGVEETATVAGWVGEHGASVIDVSTGGLVAHQQITTGPGYQVPFAATVRERTGLLVTAVGEILDGSQAEAVLGEGLADAVMVGRGWLRDPHFALRAADELGDAEAATLWPPQYLRARRR
jgi:2,4-dienoyl-CoA reductase-like NADH-dependent reductase (Old Yellow Enzyme family)